MGTRKSSLLSSQYKSTLYHALLETSPSWIVGQYICHDEGASIAEVIQNGTTLIVSNGTYDYLQQYNDTAWVITPNHTGGKLQVWYHTLVTENGKDPYRSELSGLLGGIYTIYNICESYQISTGHFIILACDELSAIQETADFVYNITAPKKEV